jgi:hypothetical protein
MKTEPNQETREGITRTSSFLLTLGVGRRIGRRGEGAEEERGHQQHRDGPRPGTHWVYRQQTPVPEPPTARSQEEAAGKVVPAGGFSSVGAGSGHLGEDKSKGRVFRSRRGKPPRIRAFLAGRERLKRRKRQERRCSPLHSPSSCPALRSTEFLPGGLGERERCDGDGRERR